MTRGKKNKKNETVLKKNKQKNLLFICIFSFSFWHSDSVANVTGMFLDERAE